MSKPVKFPAAILLPDVPDNMNQKQVVTHLRTLNNAVKRLHIDTFTALKYWESDIGSITINSGSGTFSFGFGPLAGRPAVGSIGLYFVRGDPDSDNNGIMWIGDGVAWYPNLGAPRP